MPDSRALFLKCFKWLHVTRTAEFCFLKRFKWSKSVHVTRTVEFCCLKRFKWSKVSPCHPDSIVLFF